MGIFLKEKLKDGLKHKKVFEIFFGLFIFIFFINLKNINELDYRLPNYSQNKTELIKEISYSPALPHKVNSNHVPNVNFVESNLESEFVKNSVFEIQIPDNSKLESSDVFSNFPEEMSKQLALGDSQNITLIDSSN